MNWRSCTAVLGLLLGVSRPAIAVEHYGYALVDPASGEATGYNSRGGGIEVTRYDRDAGVSVVTFRRLADPRFGGHVQVTAAGFNEGLAYCKIRSWDSSGADVQITVACYDMVSRLPMQGRHHYSVLYLADHHSTVDDVAGRRGAPVYLWTASATNPIATPERYASVPDRTYPIRVTRDAEGLYSVDMTYFLPGQRTVLVTSYGPDNRYCQLDGPAASYRIHVACAGDRPYQDSQFTILVLSPDLRDFPAARVMVKGTTPSWVTTGGSVNRSGQWLVVSPGLPHGERDQNAVFMTPMDVGAQFARCRPDSWGRSPATAAEPQMNIKPECFDQSGASVAQSYHMLVIGPPATTPIREAPVVSTTPVATTLCGPPDDGRPAPDPTRERYFVAGGDYPSDANPGWHENAMGLAHDNSFWYVTQFRQVWQIRPDRLDHARCDFDGVQCTTGASWPLPNAALAPKGDPAVYLFGAGPSRRGTAYLLVPIRTAGTTGGSYVVILTDRLDYVTSVRLPEIDYVNWVAVDGKGCLYTSNATVREPEVRALYRYVLDWNAISRRETVTPRPPERIPLRAGFRNIQGGEIAPSGLTLYLVADGIHAIDLRDGSLIRSSTNRGSSCFDFSYVGSEGERPAGLTIWDTDFRDPRITGQLHVIIRDDDWPSDDEIRIKHYSAGPSCR